MRISYLDVSSDEEEVPSRMRIFVMGESRTGKTSFIQRIINNEFSISYTHTKTVEIYDYIEIKDRYIQFIDINIDNIKNAPSLKSPTKNDALILMISGDSKLREWWEDVFIMFGCNVWVATTTELTCPDYIPKERFFIIDNMSKTNIYELVYDIVTLV
jgi:GTPase SAR1 family protein